MSERHDEWIELCAGHALGSLSEADRVRLETHVATGCEECRAAIREFADATLAIAAAAPAVAPPAGVRARVLEAVSAAPGPARARLQECEGDGTRRGRVVPFPVAALGWAAAAALLIVSVVQYRAVRALEARLDEVGAQQEQLARQLGDEREWAASMASPAAKTTLLAPTPAGAKALSGWALYDPSGRRAILVLENLELEPGHDYELWAIRGDGPRSLGLIAVEPGGRALVRLPEIPDPAGIAAFAVSYEAKGGSPDKRSPGGPVVMVGSL
jgi:anti-sigma-K factor RskA